MKLNKNYFAVIMAGGIGSRFWPMSTQEHPKQFHDLLGSGSTLLQKTFQRFSSICPTENIYIVTNERYREVVKRQLPEIGHTQILGEPMARNTAPCLAFALQHIKLKNPDASMVVAPSDHLIMDETKFETSIHKALQFAANNDVLITLGIQPTRPDTGYGYIQFHDDRNKEGFFKVKTFTEKPNREMAEYFLQTGEFLWNAGIFIWSARSIENAFNKHLPQLQEAFNKGSKLYGTEGEKAFVAKTYETSNIVSIDYGIMEKADNVYVMPATFEWSDVGTWDAVYTLMKKDSQQNVVKGDHVYLRNSSGSLVMVPDGKLVALNGVENLIVVEHDNLLLITERSREQEIRHIVNELKLKYNGKFT
ncbi:MAG: mannose-1-phosphate guanylyltransferase [Bacteroidia bacterium]